MSSRVSTCGTSAALHSFFRLDLQGRGAALIGGTLGTVTIHENWWNPARTSIAYTDRRKVELEPFSGGGLNYEAVHFCELLLPGKTESPMMTHATSMRMIAIIDAGRRDLNLRFPFEDE